MAEKKRILIISYYFAPQNVIGAVRPTKLAKYLTRMGHEVTVIAGGGLDGQIDPTLQRDLQELRDVHQLNEWSPLRDWYIRKRSRPQPAETAPSPSPTQETAQPSALKKLIMRAVDAFYVYLDWFADRNFRRLALRELNKLNGPYDVVFSSYAPISVHETAYRARQKGLAKKWIADFRDELSLPFRYQEGFRKRWAERIRRKADVVCAVSRGTLEAMQMAQCGRVLFNGFDREDLPQLQAKGADGCLRLVYCGQFNMGRRGVNDRDLTPAFRVLAQLADEGLIERSKLRLVYAGTESALMHRYAASCGLEECVEDHGPVSREESLRLQKDADILLLASWNGAQQTGILTGKMFEYMMMDKPILCCMNGELPGSAVKQVMEETGIGFCREEACAAQDDEELYAYARSLVEKWKRSEALADARSREAVEVYAYPRLAQTLLDWINE